MKKYLFTMVVMAIFAIGFAASDEDSSSNSESSSTSTEQEQEPQTKEEKKDPIANFVGNYTLYDNDGNKSRRPIKVVDDGRFFCDHGSDAEANYVKCGNIVPVSDKIFKVYLRERLYNVSDGVWAYRNNQTSTRSLDYIYKTLIFDISEGKMYLDENEYDNRDFTNPEYIKFRFTK